MTAAGRQPVLVVLGTRPEVIKLAPVVLRLQADVHRFEVTVCVTGQHRELLDTMLELFGIAPQIDLDLMRPGQSPSQVAAGVLAGLDAVLATTRPAWLLVQGDTTSAMAAALAGFHRGVRVAHVEAGLRTGDLQAPFPEELNRRVVDLLSDLLFAPTTRAAKTLVREGSPAERVHVTGNTVVDALHWIAARQGGLAADGERLVLVTAHRRESFGEPLRRVLRAVVRLAISFPELEFVFPVHPNPQVRAAVDELITLPNLMLTAPVGYDQLVRWLRACRLVITDSGGIQEEAPTFGKPTLVLREVTERPEGVEAGVAVLVGTDEERIVDTATRLLRDPAAYAAVARTANPYGDGRAAERIAALLAGLPAEPFAEGRS
jgi:UDP-N-acetylglucosamine 2-epimerase (non-hydrolysing)